MADVEQIKSDIEALQAAEADAVEELQTLADQVQALKDAGASNVSDADLEQLHDNIQAVTSGLRSGVQAAQESTGQPTPTPNEQSLSDQQDSEES